MECEFAISSAVLWLRVNIGMLQSETSIYLSFRYLRYQGSWKPAEHREGWLANVYITVCLLFVLIP